MCDNQRQSKPVIIKFYIKQKEVYIQRKNVELVIDHDRFSCFVCIYVEHSHSFISTDRCQRFLKDLANQLCMPATEILT